MLLDVLGGQLDQVLAGERALLAFGPPGQIIDYIEYVLFHHYEFWTMHDLFWL